MPPLQRLREAALTSLGLIVIGRPQLMLQNLQLNVSDGILGSGATSAPAHSAGSGDAGSPPRRPLSAQASGILQGLLSGENVVKVYTSVLSEPDVSMAVKGRVLTNLVELLRWVCGRQTLLLLLLLQSLVRAARRFHVLEHHSQEHHSSAGHAASTCQRLVGCKQSNKAPLGRLIALFVDNQHPAQRCACVCAALQG
jgi:hypothetical protein